MLVPLTSNDNSTFRHTVALALHAGGADTSRGSEEAASGGGGGGGGGGLPLRGAARCRGSEEAAKLLLGELLPLRAAAR